MVWGNTGSVGNGKPTKKINFPVLKRRQGKNTYLKENVAEIIKQVSFKKDRKIEK